MRPHVCFRIHPRTLYLLVKIQSFRFSAYASSLVLPHDSSFSNRSKKHAFANYLQVLDKTLLYYKSLHCQIIVSGFQWDVFLANVLLRSYSLANSILDAAKLFDKMPEKNLISQSTIISMYTQHGHNEKAFLSFLDFQRTCSEILNGYILASIIRASTQMGADVCGSQVHSIAIRSGFYEDMYVSTSLVDFYAKMGDLLASKLVFDELEWKTAVTWTAIIAGFAKNGKSEVSLQLFQKMRQTNVLLDRYVLSSVLHACSMLEFADGGRQIHAFLLRSETEMDVSVINVLVDCYTKCGKVETGRRLFDQMKLKNTISWTTMIAGYMQNSYNYEAIKLYVEMMRRSLKPDGYACTSVLTSCGSFEALEFGRQVHAYTIKADLKSDEFVLNGLLDMYAKCDSLPNARKVFDSISNCSVVSYNAMIEGYTRHKNVHEALGIFREMRVRSLSPSLLTFVSLLGVSAVLLCLELSRQIHSLTIKYGVSLEVFAGSALIDVYCKCACVRDARDVFDEIKKKDIVVWNALFFGYAQQEKNEEALKLYSDLQLSRERPNEFTFAALITAASDLASLQQGQQFHNQLIKIGLESDPFVTNALVDMYAKCGNMEEARKTFGSMLQMDVVCWNSMITTYAQHGEAEKALQMFEEMIKQEIYPNYVTFVGVLSACSHAGLVEDGLRHFDSMDGFGIMPGTEHYACIVSLLGRAGKLSKAREFIEQMPVKPEAVIWRSLLSASRVANDVEMGKYAAEMAIAADPSDSGSYILLSNIFAAKGMWADVKKLRERMEFNGVAKERGQSWVQMNNETRVFASGDHTRREAANVVCSVVDEMASGLPRYQIF